MWVSYQRGIYCFYTTTCVLKSLFTQSPHTHTHTNDVDDGIFCIVTAADFRKAIQLKIKIVQPDLFIALFFCVNMEVGVFSELTDTCNAFFFLTPIPTMPTMLDGRVVAQLSLLNLLNLLQQNVQLSQQSYSAN